MESACRILVVDDERRSIDLLQRALRPLGEIDSALSGEDAWELAQRNDYDLVITDQRMPGLQGAELLARIAERNAHTARVVLTGYADMQATINAINVGRVHAYITKPWLPDQLAQTARTLIERGRLARQNERLVAELATRNEELEVAMAELRRSQHELLNRERLSAVGRMVAMIVHDFRSPLAVVVSALAGLARRDLPADAREALEESREEAARMGEMCEKLLELSRIGESRIDPRPADLDEVLHSAVAAVSEEASRCGVTVEADLRCGATLPFDVNAVRRAVLNLARNAIEAMVGGGRLRISSWCEGDFAVALVADDGPGISDEIRDTLFDPFVTRGKASGSGLGLAIVQATIDGHGGEVRIVKGIGPSGAGFEIRLALRNPAAH